MMVIGVWDRKDGTGTRSDDIGKHYSTDTTQKLSAAERVRSYYIICRRHERKI